MKNCIRLALFGATTALALGPAALLAAITEAAVKRQAAGAYVLDWTSDLKDASVDVYVAGQPYAPASERTLLLKGQTTKPDVVQVQSSARPYFYIVDQSGKGQWAGERVLPLEGGRNFRDLGGYPTTDGRRVKWGQLYRSGSMASLTSADYDYLYSLGIKVVCDFRTTAERTAEPFDFPAESKITHWYRDYDHAFGDMSPDLFKGLTAEKMRDMMIEGYRRTADEQAPAYREMFRRLLADEIPLAFNCTAGKDRTGVAAALILSALGVPRDIIVEDYAMSERIVDFHSELVGNGKEKDGAFSFLSSLPREVVAPLMRTEPAYIQTTFEVIEQKYGSVEGYLTSVLGLSPADLQQLRDRLLE